MFPSTDEAKIYLTGLAETVPSISNVKAYAQIVQEKYELRQLMGVARTSCRTPGTNRTPTFCWKMPSSASLRIRPRFQRPDPAFVSMVETLTNLTKDQRPGCG